MKHVVITRYAISFDGLPLKEEWLNSRRKLFCDITIPAINAQKSKDFIWVVLIDELIYTTEVNRLKDLVSAEINVRFIGVSSPFYHDPTFWNKIINDGNIPDRLLTTRLDSDDWIHPYFCHSIQRIAKKSQKNCVILFPFGLNIEHNSTEIRILLFPNNQFASLLENRTHYPFQTVHKVDHVMLSKQEKVKWGFSLYFLWGMIIHDSNILNSVRGLRVPKIFSKIFWNLKLF